MEQPTYSDLDLTIVRNKSIEIQRKAWAVNHINNLIGFKALLLVVPSSKKDQF